MQATFPFESFPPRKPGLQFPLAVVYHDEAVQFPVNLLLSSSVGFGNVASGQALPVAQILLSSQSIAGVPHTHVPGLVASFDEHVMPGYLSVRHLRVSPWQGEPIFPSEVKSHRPVDVLQTRLDFGSHFPVASQTPPCFVPSAFWQVSPDILSLRQDFKYIYM